MTQQQLIAKTAIKAGSRLTLVEVVQRLSAVEPGRTIAPGQRFTADEDRARELIESGAAATIEDVRREVAALLAAGHQLPAVYEVARDIAVERSSRTPRAGAGLVDRAAEPARAVTRSSAAGLDVQVGAQVKQSVMRNVLGLSASATEDELGAALRKLVAGTKAASVRLVDLAISKQLLPYTHRKSALEFAAKDPSGFAELLQHTPPAASLERQITGAARAKVDASGGQLDLTAAFIEVGAEFPDLVAAYREERRAKTRTQLRRIS